MKKSKLKCSKCSKLFQKSDGLADIQKYSKNSTAFIYLFFTNVKYCLFYRKNIVFI